MELTTYFRSLLDACFEHFNCWLAEHPLFSAEKQASFQSVARSILKAKELAERRSQAESSKDLPPA